MEKHLLLHLLWSRSEGFVVHLVVPVEHFRLSRLKHDLCIKVFVHPVLVFQLSVDLLSSAALRHLFLCRRQSQWTMSGCIWMFNPGL